MIIKGITVDENLREYPANAGKNFPLTAMYSDLGDWAAPTVPWHWHRELEFAIVLQGKMSVRTPHDACVLGPEEGFFINRNVLHRMDGVNGERPIYLVQLVDEELLAGASGSVFERKYLKPVLERRELEMMPFRLHDTNHRRILEYVRGSYEAVDAGTEGYEIIARNDLSSAWLLMMKALPETARDRRTGEDQTETRVKRMLLYIQEHYAEKISLDEIAMAANISTRECLRDFRNRLNITPFRYLIDCRLDAAARQLMTTGRSVTDIAGACGFASGSYFTKLFREKYGMTAMAYRKKGRTL